jgi:membrane-associated phospholipid phosphatase
MTWWSTLSALGGLDVTAPLALAIAAWLAGARSWRLALAWCLLFAAALGLAAGSQVAFIGWGWGVQSLDFTGFSGHATRAAAVFPAALFLLVEKQGSWWKWGMVLAGVMLAAGVAVARVMVGAHSPSEALTGCLLGLGAAALFMARARTVIDYAPKPVLPGLLAAIVLLLPHADPINSHQWLTAAALKLSGHDRAHERDAWQQRGSGPAIRHF